MSLPEDPVAGGTPARVTVVMPCYNAANHLRRSVGSVLAQDMSDWELIVVDDGSSDGSWNVLDELAASDPRVHPIRQCNAGAAAARNRGLAEVRAGYTAFLDADDTWHPSFLSVMLAALAADSGAGIAYCGWQSLGLGPAGDEPYVPPEYELGDKLDTLLAGCPWPIHAALARSDIVRDVGGFDETLSSCMDYDLWLRLGTVQRLVRVPRVLAYYHHHGNGQITSHRARIALNHWRVQRKFLAATPGAVERLGTARVRELTLGELLHRGYLAYWKRDLSAARAIFREVMKRGYGRPKDWGYMLPAWLPESWHRWFIDVRDGRVASSDQGR